jgi:hypothetical protein
MLNEELSMIADRDATEDLERLSTDARSLLMLSTDMGLYDSVIDMSRWDHN